ncbi:hypothetical protein [Bartonella sp. TT119HLJHH]
MGWCFPLREVVDFKTLYWFFDGVFIGVRAVVGLMHDKRDL